MDVTCSESRAVGVASQCGQWTEHLTRHVSECDRCAEAVFRYGVRSLKENTRPARLDPVVLWWKGRAAARARSIERASSVASLTHLTTLIAAVTGSSIVGSGILAATAPLREAIIAIAPGLGVAALIMLAVGAGIVRLAQSND